MRHLFMARTGIYIVLKLKNNYMSMKPKQFNICPSCKHKATCVLTRQKNLVWSCSEYDELMVKPMVPNKMGIHHKQRVPYQ